MKRLILALLFLCGTALAQTDAIQGWCDGPYGAQQALVSGLPSTNYLLGNIPLCTVTVYLTGSQTKANIFSDPAGDPLSNPFTATTKGHWIFWVADGVGVDVVGSGGIPPNNYPAPLTLCTDCKIGGGGGSPEAIYQHNGTEVGQQPALNFVDGGITFTVTNDGSNNRVDVSASGSSGGAVSAEDVPTLMGVPAQCHYPNRCTNSDVPFTLFPASDDYVFKVPPNSSFGSSAMVQDCVMTNLGSPSQNSCACTHTYSGTTVTISCKLPHVFPGDSIVAFGAIICGLGCGQYPQFTDSQSNIYTQLDPETTGPSGGASVDGITVGVAGNYSDTVTATFLSINSEYYSSLHVIELRGITGVSAHGGAGSSSGPATFPGVTTTGEQAILGFSFDNTYGAPGCSYSAGTGYQMYNQDAIANGSFGDEGIIETANGTYTPTINRNSGCLVGGGTAQTVALAYTGSTTGSDILWPQRLRFSTLVVGGDFDPLATGTGLFSPDGQRVSALTFGSGLTLSGSTLEATGSGGTVTSVSGTANQIDVATGTTTPVISLDSAITFPGTITMGANAADFSSATSFKPPGGGGTFTVGTANINWATLGTGVVLNTTTTGAKAVIAAVGTKCYPYQGSSGTGCDTPSGTANFVSKFPAIVTAQTDFNIAPVAVTFPANFGSSGTTPASYAECSTNPTGGTVTWTLTDTTTSTTLGTVTITTLGVVTFATTGGTTQSMSINDYYTVVSGTDAGALNCVIDFRAGRN